MVVPSTWVVGAAALLHVLPIVLTSLLLFLPFFLSVLLVELVTKKKKEEEEEVRVWLVCMAVRAPSLWLVAGQGCALVLLVGKSLIACYLLLEMLVLAQMLLLLAGDVERNPGPITGKPMCVFVAPFILCEDI